MSDSEGTLPEPLMPSPRQVIRAAVIFEGGVGLFAWGVGHAVHCPPESFVLFNRAGWLWGFAAALPMLAMFWATIRFPLGPLGELKDFVDEHLTPLFRGTRWWQLLAVSVLAGIGEEFLFRGVIQQGIARLAPGWEGAIAGVIIASVMFGLAHAMTPMYAVLAAAISVYLGILLIATENLLAPIVAHAAYDFVALCYLVRQDARRTATG